MRGHRNHRRAAWPLGGLVALALAWSMPATAETRLGEMVARDAWMHAPAALGGASAAYFRLANRGRRVDRLISVSSRLAPRAEIHTYAVESGHLRMKRLRSVEIHPGAPLIFAPGGPHIMLIDIKGALDTSKPVQIRLRFERAGQMELEVPIVSRARHGPPPPSATPKAPTIPRAARQGRR